MLVYDPAKDGVDAGVLCGEEPVGVVATDDRGGDPRARRRLRAVHAAHLRPRRRRRAARVGNERRHDARRAVRRRPPARRRAAGRGSLDACERGGTSIYATGSSPGFITDALPFALLSLQRRVESIEIDEFAEHVAARLAAHALRADGVRAAARLVRPEPRRVPARRVQPVARAARRGRGPAGRRVDRAPARSRRRGRRRRSSRASSRPGSVAAQRTTIVGHERRRRGRAVHGELVLHDRRRAGVGSPADGMAGAGARRRAASTSSSTFPVPLEELGSFTPGVHREPAGERGPVRVRGARPGILSTTDLPPITPAGPRPCRSGPMYFESTVGAHPQR